MISNSINYIESPIFTENLTYQTVLARSLMRVCCLDTTSYATQSVPIEWSKIPLGEPIKQHAAPVSTTIARPPLTPGRGRHIGTFDEFLLTLSGPLVQLL